MYGTPTVHRDERPPSMQALWELIKVDLGDPAMTPQISIPTKSGPKLCYVVSSGTPHAVCITMSSVQFRIEAYKNATENELNPVDYSAVNGFDLSFKRLTTLNSLAMNDVQFTGWNHLRAFVLAERHVSAQQAITLDSVLAPFRKRVKQKITW